MKADLPEIPFADVAYLEKRYGRDLSDHYDQFDLLLEEASQKLLDEMPAAVGRASAVTLRMIVGRMVWDAAALDTPQLPPGLESSQFGVGPFQQTFNFTNASQRLFVSREERRQLRGGQRAGVVDVLQHHAPEGDE